MNLFGQYSAWWRFKARVLVKVSDSKLPVRFPALRKWLCDRGIHNFETRRRLRKPTGAPSTWYTEVFDVCADCGDEG